MKLYEWNLTPLAIRLLVARIALVNPSLSTQIEALLVRMAQSGQIRGRVSDTQLLGLLDQVRLPQSIAIPQ